MPRILWILFLWGTVFSCTTVPVPPAGVSVQFSDATQALYRVQASRPTPGDQVELFERLFSEEQAYIDTGTGTAEGPDGPIVVRWRTRTTVTGETSSQGARIDFEEVQLVSSRMLALPSPFDLRGDERLPFVLSRLSGAGGTIEVEVSGRRGEPADATRYSKRLLVGSPKTEYRFLRKDDQVVLGRFVDDTLVLTTEGEAYKAEILDFAVFLTSLRAWFPAVDAKYRLD